MPKNKIWIEWVFDKLPLSKDNTWKQMTFRVLSLVFIWFVGLIIYSVDGKGETYFSNITPAMNFIGSGTIVLYGSYMIQKELPSVIQSFKPMLKLEEDAYNALSKRITSFSYSIIPCLLIASILMIAFSGDNAPRFELEGIGFSQIWDYLYGFFIYLLSATGIWMGVSILMTIFVISRQPLNLELTSTTIEKFKGLTMLALWFSLFYFLALSVGVVINFLGASTVTAFELLFSPFMIYILIGVVTVFFPFYNIHLTLLRMKRNELTLIEEDYNTLQKKMVLVNEKGLNERSESESTALIGEILSLQLRERIVRNAPDWPIDINFITRLSTLVLIPALVRVTVELFNRFYL